MRCELITHTKNKCICTFAMGMPKGKNNADIDAIDFSDENFMVISFGSTVFFFSPFTQRSVRFNSLMRISAKCNGIRVYFCVYTLIGTNTFHHKFIF